MVEIFQVILLSLIEGITEFLPVSSTGHLIVGGALLDFDGRDGVFEIFIQFGAVVALLLYYRKTFAEHASLAASSMAIRRFWLLILLACVPAALLGLLFNDLIFAALFSPRVVALALIAGGIALLLVERLPSVRDNSRGRPLTDVTLRQALIVGGAQALALIPGMSRSGASIVGGMLAGMHRRQATEYSFFLAIPLLGSATLYRLIIALGALQPHDLALLLLGAFLSSVFAWLAIDWLLTYVTRNKLAVFGIYRVIAGALILAASLAGVIS